MCANPADQFEVHLAADGTGGVVVAWSDSRGNEDFRPDYYAQRVTYSGAFAWAADGVPIVASPGIEAYLDIAGDGAGGAIVVWTDDPLGVSDLYAQRLDAATGAGQWGAAGTPITQDPTRQEFPHVIFDGARALVVWNDIPMNPGPWLPRIFAQALGPLGNAIWAPGGVVVSPSAIQFTDTDPVSDGLGGFIIAWSSQSGAGATHDVYAQRVDASGLPVWGPNGVALSLAPGGQIVKSIVSDARGGAIVVWDDGRNLPGYTEDVYAARVTHAGVATWTADGVPVSSADSVQIHSVAVPDGAGGAVVAWIDTRNAGDDKLDIFAQQVGASGSAGVRAPSVDCQPDLCGYAYTDFGDAPENLPGFPSGSLGHYPTCKTATTAGTQEIECGAALSTPPGSTGYVEHVGTYGDANYVTFGCQKGPAVVGVDSEVDGLVNVGTGPPPLMPVTSACDPAAPLQNFEDAFGGLWFGGDDLASPAWGVALASRPTFRNCATASLRLRTGACGPQNATAYLNVLVDWNQDGDWNDVARCGAAGAETCAPEWAVKNALVSVRPGCDSLDTPVFQVGPATGGTWMRLTLTLAPVTDDFPWAGSALNSEPGGATGAFAGGETEDYPVTIVEAVDVGAPPTPDALVLAPPAPNPGAGETDVRFALPHASQVRLGVYDLAGRRVRSLASGMRPAGTHVVRWDGRDETGAPAPSGLYFVRLEAAGATRVRTVVRTR
uniref:T9SS type A sorting domain-containing protein n=1 Tax=Eiseniibacteriota bacterium TaxID=2212470 RepID=A0A832I0D8_UNCEI